MPWQRRSALTFWLVLATAGSSPGIAESPVELSGGTTEIRLNAHLLADLGITVSAAEAGENGGDYMDFTVSESSSLGMALPSGSYRGPVSGFLAHESGFVLEWPGDRVSLVGFELHPGIPPNTFELRATDGTLAFELDHPHPQPSPDGSEYFFLDLDLRLSAQLAGRMGKAHLAGLALGEAHVRAGVREPERVESGSYAASLVGGAGGVCTPDYNGPVDVRLESMSAVFEIHHDASRVALAPSVTIRNVGTADIKWFRSIPPDGTAPLDVVGEHPLLVMQLYRTAGGRIEMIGRSDVKHAFFSANSPPCACQPDQVLFNDCTDLYGAFTNAHRKFLAPRDEIDVSADTWAARWTSTGSHFDGPAPDDDRGHDEVDHLDPFDHRLVAAASDLQTPDGEYRVEAWYLVRDDVDIFNSMGHRRVSPTFTTTWTFPFEDLDLTRGSVLDTWVDPLAPPPGAANVTVSTSPDEGELKLAVRTSTLPTGLIHYEYALMNFDFGRQIDSFTVPLPAGAIVQNAWFRDADSTGSNDWSAAVGATDITWQAPAGNALDWGTLFNFAFDAAASPAAAQPTLGVLETGSPMALTPTILVPATPVPASEIEVTLAGGGSGSVASLPTGIACAGDCWEYYADGLALVLGAAATSGSAFTGWEEASTTVSLDLSLGFTVGGDRDLTAVFESCQEHVNLPPQTVSTPTVFYACESLTAGAGFVAASEVIFRAGRSIVLENGFSVAAGGDFHAEIAPEQSTLP